MSNNPYLDALDEDKKKREQAQSQPVQSNQPVADQPSAGNPYLDALKARQNNPIQTPSQQAAQTVQPPKPGFFEQVGNFFKTLAPSALNLFGAQPAGGDLQSEAKGTSFEQGISEQQRKQRVSAEMQNAVTQGKTDIGSRAGAMVGELAPYFNPYTAALAGSQKILNAKTPTEVAGAIIDTFVTTGLAKFTPIAGGAEGTLAERGVGAAVKDLLKVKTLGTGAGIGGTFGLSQSLENQDTNVKDVIKNIYQGIKYGILTEAGVRIGIGAGQDLAKTVGLVAQHVRGVNPEEAQKISDEAINIVKQRLENPYQQEGSVRQVLETSNKFVIQEAPRLGKDAEGNIVKAQLDWNPTVGQGVMWVTKKTQDSDILQAIQKETGITPEELLKARPVEAPSTTTSATSAGKIVVPQQGAETQLKLGNYGKELYHETSAQNAEQILKSVSTGEHDTPINASGINVANTPELALGQGGKGVNIVFDATKVAGRFTDNPKPGAEFLHTQGKTDELTIERFFGKNPIKYVDVPKEEFNKVDGVTKSGLNTAGLDASNPETLPNGKLRFTQRDTTEKGLVDAQLQSQADQQKQREAEIALHAEETRLPQSPTKAQIETAVGKNGETVKQYQSLLTDLKGELNNHPGKQLEKYANKNGDLPEVLGGKATSQFGKKGDVITADILKQFGKESGSGDAQKVLDEYRALRDQTKKISDQLATTRQQGKELRTTLVNQKEPAPAKAVATPIKPIQAQGERVPNKLAQRIQADTQEQLGGLSKNAGTHVVAHDVDQAAKATEILRENPQRAIDIAFGREGLPKDVSLSAVQIAVENYARATSNKELLTELFNKSEISTRIAQELHGYSTRSQESPVRFMQALQERRMAGGGERKLTLQANRQVATMKSEMQTAIQKKFSSAQSVIDSLICK